MMNYKTLYFNKQACRVQRSYCYIIEFMSSYEFLMVSLLSIAILKFKLFVQILFFLHCGWNILHDR